jgi:hypothetical protein
MIEEETYIRHTARDHSFESRSLLLVGLVIPTRQLHCYDLRVI